jgi:hypothetical protein
MGRDVARLTLNPTRNIAEPGAAATGNELGLFTAGPILRRISIRLIGLLDDNAVMSADSYADLMERLFAAYETRHSLTTIEDVVTQCRTDLTGQTPPGARFELLERLVRRRLDDLPPSSVPLTDRLRAPMSSPQRAARATTMRVEARQPADRLGPR